MSKQTKGDWLGIGGVSSHGYGMGRIEVRVANNDRASWAWRNLTDEERSEILRHMSAWTKANQALTSC